MLFICFMALAREMSDSYQYLLINIFIFYFPRWPKAGSRRAPPVATVALVVKAGSSAHTALRSFSVP